MQTIETLKTIVILVGGFKHDFYVPFHIWDVILPIDVLHIFQDGYIKPHFPVFGDGHFITSPWNSWCFSPPSPWISPPRIDGDFSMTSHKINHMARLEATDMAMARTARIVITDYYWL